MKIHFTLTLLSLLLIYDTSFSQQALFGGANITSPEINADNSVTFRFQSPLQVAGCTLQVAGYEHATRNLQLATHY